MRSITAAFLSVFAGAAMAQDDSVYDVLMEDMVIVGSPNGPL